MSYRHTDRSQVGAGLIEPPPIGLTLTVNETVDYQDKYRGAMLGTGIGDALGGVAEGMPASDVRARYGRIADYIPWSGWVHGPKGTLSDDTELALCIAESIVEHGALVPEDLANRFVAWVEVGRGIGSATHSACSRLSAGSPWYEAGSASAGNGSAMRAAPLGLAQPTDIDALRLISAQSCVITHADPTAVLSTVVMAFAVAYLAHTQPAELDIDAFRSALEAATAGLDDPELSLRSRAGSTSLMSRIGDVFDMRTAPIEEIFALTHNGAFVTESLPAAIGAFLRFADDPEEAIIAAVGGGYDADTVAAMAGGLAGAYHGASALPERWISDLEFRSGLAGLADNLLDMNGLPPKGRPPLDEPGEGCYRPVVIDGERWITQSHFHAAKGLDGVRRRGVRLQPHPSAAVQFAAD